MTTSRDINNKLEFECDRCGAVDGGNHGDFQTAWAEVRDDGWLFSEEEQTHLCGICREELGI